MRTYDEGVREHMLGAIKRICCAECSASNAPRDPEITIINRYPLTVNDERASTRLADAFGAWFGDRAYETAPAAASEDFSVFGRAWKVPYVFWFVGCTDPQVYEQAKAMGKINSIPSNHSPQFAPLLHPTLRTGLESMLGAAFAWFGNAE
ncbi:hypothetical protein [Pseudomonas baetica]|uniref:hypothetical protein n=1 Tax=Pseudomonas baetica TaxID=674054 RepID=UPI0024063AE5|nr:hypothetical protein [Pseudomonas baetica]MDF9773205.1 metal-dependent amidase/aminoacylase/carboxypeptidase family protein [Pseudomonas baetica]